MRMRLTELFSRPQYLHNFSIVLDKTSFIIFVLRVTFETVCAISLMAQILTKIYFPSSMYDSITLNFLKLSVAPDSVFVNTVDDVLPIRHQCVLAHSCQLLLNQSVATRLCIWSESTAWPRNVPIGDIFVAHTE